MREPWMLEVILAINLMFSNEEFFERNQSIYRLKIIENQETKMTAADAAGRAREFN